MLKRFSMAFAVTVPLVLASLPDAFGAPPFNIILVSIDTLAAGHLSLHGYAHPTTPSLDKLGKESVVFEEAFSQASWTTPSHYSMFTGVYPETHQIVALPGYGGAYVLDPRFKTIAEYAKAAGLYTAWAGTDPSFKYFLANQRGLGRGVDEFDSMEWAWTDMPKLRAVLAKLSSRKFFLFAHTYRVHSPYTPSPAYRRQFDPTPDEPVALTEAELSRLKLARHPEITDIHLKFFGQFEVKSASECARLAALYDAGIRSVDDQIGELVKELRKLGIYDETLLIVTSDHGESFGEHGHFEHMNDYRQELHVPLVLKLPKSLAVKPHRVRETVLGIDLLPTVLEMLGTPVPPEIEGKSLLPLMRGRPFNRTGDFFATALDPWTQAVWNKEWKYIAPARLASPSGGLGGDELYKIDEDPGELKNLAAENPGILARMKNSLNSFIMSKTGH